MKIKDIPPKKDSHFETVLARYQFTEDERRDMGLQLSRAVQESGLIEEQKKQIMSEFKAKLDAVQANSSSLAIKIGNGYEMRETRCRVELFPTEGKKRFFLPETDELIKEDVMSHADYQQLLPMELDKIKADPATE